MKRESFNSVQVSIVLRINQSQTRDLIKQRRLGGRSFGKHWQISRDELIAVCVFSGVSTRWTERF